MFLEVPLLLVSCSFQELVQVIGVGGRCLYQTKCKILRANQLRRVWRILTAEAGVLSAAYIRVASKDMLLYFSFGKLESYFTSQVYSLWYRSLIST